MSMRKLYTSSIDAYQQLLFKYIYMHTRIILLYIKSKKNKNAYAFGTSFYFIKKNILYKNEIYIQIYIKYKNIFQLQANIFPSKAALNN